MLQFYTVFNYWLITLHLVYTNNTNVLRKTWLKGLINNSFIVTTNLFNTDIKGLPQTDISLRCFPDPVTAGLPSDVISLSSILNFAVPLGLQHVYSLCPSTIPHSHNMLSPILLQQCNWEDEISHLYLKLDPHYLLTRGGWSWSPARGAPCIN